MIRKSLCFFVALFLWPLCATLAADPPSIDAFSGRWTADQVSSDFGDLPEGALDLQVQPEENGFRLSWHDLGARVEGGQESEGIEAQFLSTNRPGVYEYVAESGSLLTRMFASPSTGNPLDGETLLWARLDDQTLAVYSMKVGSNGGFSLDHYSWTLTDNRLRLTFSRRTESLEEPTKVEGDLVAEGG